jgi:peptidoglycan/xylan/chitin deacetylase (PgdA/CDA1 family)
LSARFCILALVLVACADSRASTPPARDAGPKTAKPAVAVIDPAVAVDAAPAVAPKKSLAPARLRNPAHGKFHRRVTAQAARLPKRFFLEARRPGRDVALTFDDGPDPVATRRILKVLDRAKIKATFFVVGKRAERWPKLIREIARRGHVVAGHGYTHVPLTPIATARAYKSHIQRTNEVLAKVLGKHPSFFRPPYGVVTDRQVRYFAKRGVLTVDWSVDTFDINDKYNAPHRMISRVLRHVHDGAIVLMHSLRHRPNTPKMLPRLIRALRKRGYRFRTVPELLGFEAYR